MISRLLACLVFCLVMGIHTPVLATSTICLEPPCRGDDDPCTDKWGYPVECPPDDDDDDDDDGGGGDEPCYDKWGHPVACPGDPCSDGNCCPAGGALHGGGNIAPAVAAAANCDDDGGGGGPEKCPPIPGRPSASSFWGKYPRYPNPSYIMVWRDFIKGWIGEDYLNDPNSCAARISYGLNYGGHLIKVHPAANVNVNGNLVPPWHGDGLRYIISAQSLREYLRREWKEPDYTLPGETVETLKEKLKDCPNGLFIVGSATHIGVVKRGYNDPYPQLLNDGGWAWLLTD